MPTSKIEANGGVLKIMDIVEKSVRNIGYRELNLFENDYGVPGAKRVIFLGWKNEKTDYSPARSIKKDITSVQAMTIFPSWVKTEASLPRTAAA